MIGQLNRIFIQVPQKGVKMYKIMRTKKVRVRTFMVKVDDVVDNIEMIVTF